MDTNSQVEGEAQTEDEAKAPAMARLAEE